MRPRLFAQQISPEHLLKSSNIGHKQVNCKQPHKSSGPTASIAWEAVLRGGRVTGAAIEAWEGACSHIKETAEGGRGEVRPVCVGSRVDRCVPAEERTQKGDVHRTGLRSSCDNFETFASL